MDKTGRLTLLGKDQRPYKSNYTIVKCECGTEKSVKTSDLTRGKIKSCGCMLAEIRAKGQDKEEKNRKTRVWNAQIKLECLTQYGPDRVLQCSAVGCGIQDPDMLTLDHINNDGAEDRVQGRNCTGVRLYWVLKSEGYPLGFATLCCNHQSKKEMMRRRELAHLRETQNV
jgi:hypothetical protein